MKFVGLNPLGGDHTAFIDSVRILGAPQAGYGLQWLLTDQLGTPRMVFDESGALANIRRHYYLPFGEELTAQQGLRGASSGYATGDSVRQQFTSKERDVETGLDYFGTRYYGSTQGRFTSVDPLMASAAAVDPQSWNRYAHSSNNPVRFVDDDGRIKRDQSGNIIFDAAGQPVVSTHPSGARAAAQPGYIYADNGDQIEACRNTSSDTRFDCDCHGPIFSDGHLLDDRTNEPQIGDVAVYRENGEVVHSTTVTGVENSQITVSGLGGIEPNSQTTTAQGAWAWRNSYLLPQRNDNRTLEERQRQAAAVKSHDKQLTRLAMDIERQLGPPPLPPPPRPKPKHGKKGLNEDN